MRLRSKTELAALAALAYVPFLASSPGQVSADSKQDLYLDPGRFLARAAELWDPHLGAGTVPHQNLGYLFPTGPWFWVLDQLGVPDWVAQRLWWGTLSLVAVLGARWLFRQLGTGRLGALAGALVYVLTPYQLAFTARMSVLLLGWAALPWLVGLTMRATRSRDWRAPALVALVLLAAGGVNASSLALVLLAPAGWVALEATRGPAARRRALAAAGRLAVLGTGISLWWVAGLRLQAAHGLPVLQLTENVRTVAEFSTPGDILRGIGNWFFYGRDRTGYSIDQAADYASGDVVIALSYLVAAAALAAAFVLRWAHRAYFGLLVVGGTVVGVGAWPYDEPSPYGALWRTVTSETSVGLALRNSPRVVPVVVLGLAGLLAGAVGAVPAPRWRTAAAAAVGAAALAGLAPVATHGFGTKGMQRPEVLPGYWSEAIAALSAGDAEARVLEVPGSSFAAYRWGTTVDPITPGLIGRPYLAREVLPSGTAGTANLLDALDRRMQQGWFEAPSLAPVARLLGVGTVVLRADLDRSGRFDSPPPLPLWQALRSPGSELGPPQAYGPPGGDGTVADLPAVALFEVNDPAPVVRVLPTTRPLVLAGDGDGIVDAAAAGLLDGSGLVQYSAALDDRALGRALDAGADLILTDSNRRRIQTWFYSLRDTRGPTERAGETAPDPTGYDRRLEVFPGTTDASRTVVEQIGGVVESTAGGGPERPEDRAARAVDGDLRTAWRVGGDPRGEVLRIVPSQPVHAEALRLVQPASAAGERRLARVAVTVDDSPPVVVELGPASLTPAGQAVALPGGRASAVTVTILETEPPSSSGASPTPVGLAEVRIGDLTISETVRLPVDLLARAGAASAVRRLDVVLTRLRLDLPGTGRQDDELRLDRTFVLPTDRSFGLTGTARPAVGSAREPEPELCRDDLLTVDGTPVAVRLTPNAQTYTLTACDGLDLAAGSHRVVASVGSSTGIDIDRVVLSSGPDGGAEAPGLRGAQGAAGGSAVTVLDQGPSTLELRVRTDGRPFWLVLGQSESDGWRITTTGAAVEGRQLVNGYANGWLITPDEAGTLTVRLRWGPQRLVWVGFALSALTFAAALIVLWRHRRGRVPEPPLAARPALAWRRAPEGGRPRFAVASAVVVGVVVGLAVAPPAIVAVSTVVLGISLLLSRGPLLLAGVASLGLLASRAGHWPSWAWLAVLLLGGELLVERFRARRPTASR